MTSTSGEQAENKRSDGRTLGEDQASASAFGTPEGGGESKSRADMRLVMRAIRAGWTISPLVKQAVIARATGVLTKTDSKPRDVARASQTLVAIERLQVDAAAHEDRMQRLDAGEVTDRVEMIESISDDALAAIARTRGARGAREPAKAPAKPRAAPKAAKAPRKAQERPLARPRKPGKGKAG